MKIAFLSLAPGLLLGMGIILSGSCHRPNGDKADWPVYGGNAAGNRYSSLRQIDLNNVKGLRVAWIYDSNDPLTGHREGHEIQCQPIVVDGILYGTSGTLKLFALDAATGRELWKFDPFAGSKPFYHQNRGVAYWQKRRRSSHTIYCRSELICRRCTYGEGDRQLWPARQGQPARRA